MTCPCRQASRQRTAHSGKASFVAMTGQLFASIEWDRAKSATPLERLLSLLVVEDDMYRNVAPNHGSNGKRACVATSEPSCGAVASASS